MHALPVIAEVGLCDIPDDQGISVSSVLRSVLFGGSQLGGVFIPNYLRCWLSMHDAHQLRFQTVSGVDAGSFGFNFWCI